MSGRGRGRGRGAVPPSVASAPFNFGSSNASGSTSGIYNSRAEPSQKFPDLLIHETPDYADFSTFELKSSEYSERIHDLFRISPAFRPLKAVQTKIDRYSDKYLSGKERKERLNSIETNLEFFPEELCAVYNELGGSSNKSSLRKKSSVSSTVSFQDTISQLDSLAQREESNNEEDPTAAANEKAKADGDDDDEKPEEVEDEEFEDETDYNFSYFDNGEDYGDYEDGNDEAVF